MKELYFVYILESIAFPNHYYTGFTTDVAARIIKHNQGGCSSTKKYRPWRIKNFFAFDNEEKAHRFERYLKSGSGREFARRHF